MTRIKTAESAQLFIGLKATIAEQVYDVCGFKIDGKKVYFTFRHENGQEIVLDSKSCLDNVIVDGIPMGEMRMNLWMDVIFRCLVWAFAILSVVYIFGGGNGKS